MVGNTQLSLAGQSSSETMLSMMKHAVKLFNEVMKHDVLHHFTIQYILLILTLILIVIVLVY